MEQNANFSSPIKVLPRILPWVVGRVIGDANTRGPDPLNYPDLATA